MTGYYTDASGNSTSVSTDTLTLDGSLTYTKIIAGAYNLSGDAKDYTVKVTDGIYSGTIYGGYSNTNAIGNTVKISGGTLTGTIYGGYSSGNTTGNTIEVSGGTLDGAALIGGSNSDVTNNKLLVKAKYITVKTLKNFASLIFVPSNVTAGDTMLSLELVKR